MADEPHLDDPPTLVKTLTYTAELDDVVVGDRTVVHIITTDAVDRDREVVIPKGLDLERFRANPVVLAGHDGNKFPIGKSLWIKAGKMGRALTAKTQFARSADGEAAFELYRDGILTAWSIGFIPRDSGKPTAEELRMRPEWKNARSIVRKAELVEYSAVAVPANPEALTLAVSKGLALPSWIESLPPPPPREVVEPPPVIEPALPSLRDRVALPSLKRAKTKAQRDQEIVAALLGRDWSPLILASVREQIDRMSGRV